MGVCFCTGACRTLGYCPNLNDQTWRPVTPMPSIPTTPQPTITPIPQPGWKCPSCGCGIAPWMPYCPYCAPKRDDGPTA